MGPSCSVLGAIGDPRFYQLDDKPGLPRHGPLAHLASLVTHLCVVLPEGAQAARAWEPGPHTGVRTAHPVSWPLSHMNEESFRQSVLSICSLQICINSISDVMTWSNPTYASSVRCADRQRTLNDISGVMVGQRGSSYRSGSIWNGEH